MKDSASEVLQFSEWSSGMISSQSMKSNGQVIGNAWSNESKTTDDEQRENIDRRHRR